MTADKHITELTDEELSQRIGVIPSRAYIRELLRRQVAPSVIGAEASFGNGADEPKTEGVASYEGNFGSGAVFQEYIVRVQAKDIPDAGPELTFEARSEPRDMRMSPTSEQAAAVAPFIELLPMARDWQRLVNKHGPDQRSCFLLWSHEDDEGNKTEGRLEVEDFERLARVFGVPGDAEMPDATPDADGWITWVGGECPVPGDAEVKACFRDGGTFIGFASELDWQHHDFSHNIRAYRLVTPAPAPAPDPRDEEPIDFGEAIDPNAPWNRRKQRPGLPAIEVVSAKVHEAWMRSKIAQGVTSRKSETGEELMAPYADLSEAAKDLDRGTVRAVYDAILASTPAAPERDGEAATAFSFDRYINGVLMAEGVSVEKARGLSSAMQSAARLALRGQNGEVPVLVLTATPPQPASPDEGLVAELNGWKAAYEQMRETAVANARERNATQRALAEARAEIERLRGLISHPLLSALLNVVAEGEDVAARETARAWASVRDGDALSPAKKEG